MTGTNIGAAHPWSIEAHGGEVPGRWLWTVKWLLVVPHVIVLAVLWTVFAVLTVVAGVAVLVTGRYPRGLFDVNVGVLRWTWRVGHYGYLTLGTDRYPPFTLRATDHPARLDVAYPARLSRPLVLVKWLLAVPHLLIAEILLGAVSRSGPASPPVFTAGLLGVLVLVAGVCLTVRRQYPAGLFDLIVGLNRWVFRFLVYVALMTDVYPPFRLDQGGREPAAGQPVTGRAPALVAGGAP
jgi:Domain of unknown function (DUF4389)